MCNIQISGCVVFRKNSKVCCIQILPSARSAIRVKVFPRGSEKFRAKIWKDKFNFIFLGGVRNKVKKAYGKREK